MRKYLIVAIAAFSVIAFSGTAYADAIMDVKVTPSKAGKKKKAKNSKIKLKIENTETQRTLSELTITTAKTFRLSAKGLTKCDADILDPSSGEGPDGCPNKAIVGKGIATARLGVNSPTPTPLTFDVTAVVTGSKSIDFYLEARELTINVVAHGKLKGRKLTIEVPQAAQQPAPNVWAGLVSLETTLKGKKGKRYLASTTGCKGKKHKFSAVLTFVDNTVSPAGDVRTKANAKCKK